ncbi:heavy metal translocating P-type ATPase [Undibacterium sp. Xuan67W]|uniref:heavy metal translocating P-type ATPase n=1 Tax=Undibacterium sp. Xuan67W TaxID=3413057 RepID=UPI003BEFBEBA
MTLHQPTDSDTASQHDKLSLSGIRCAACAQLIIFRVRQLPGVTSFNINAASHKAEVAWQPHLTSLKKIIQSIIDLGYGAFPAGQTQGEVQQRENKMALWRLFVAGFAMMQIMMYAFPAYLVPVPQIDGDLTPDVDRLLKIASLIITIPVVGFSAMPFFTAALRDVRNRHVGMDVPVSLGILLTFVASVWGTFHGGTVYFDSVIMFVFLLLGARLIEARVQLKTTAALRVLTQLKPMLAHRLTHYPENRQTVSIDTADLQINDVLMIAAGEQVPADGVVIEGQSDCDESLMTGESHPLPKSPGDELIAGSINLSGVLLMRAQRVGNDTQLSSLVSMMESAANEKPPLVQLADKHASRFLLVILIVAALTAFVWWRIDPDRALWIAISVIVVTCPCALSLATPGVMSAAIGQMAKHGVLVAKGKAIESMAKATHCIFDKTGTLTFGKLRLFSTVYCAGHDLLSSQLTSAQVDAISLAMTSHSMHPVSKAIADAISSNNDTGNGNAWDEVAVTHLCELVGGGIEARIEGKKYRLGRYDFVVEICPQLCPLPSQFADKTISVLGNEDGFLSMYALEDTLRDDAVDAVRCIQQSGKKILLLSGDREGVVRSVAQQCGIVNARGNLSPADKYAVVQDLQRQGAIVMMVGDGMNDGPVLSLADISVAMGQGAPVSQSRSDLLLMSNRLSDLEFAMTIATKAMQLIRQNLIWAIVYNLIAIPAAVTGLLEPWHAAVGMSVSSLIVVLNALRLLRMNQPVTFNLTTPYQERTVTLQLA